MVELVFTITQGRTGTHSLYDLFKRHDPATLAFHEHLDASAHGILTPDIGHLRRFNTDGLTPEITDFWKRKLAIARRMTVERGLERYLEAAHMNAKCGVVEYALSVKAKDTKSRFRFIIMNRALEKIARSIYEHGGMRHIENMWLWYLHPLYPKNLVNSTPYSKHDYLGKIAWYVREIEARKSAYQVMLLREGFDVLTIDIDQPDWVDSIARAYGFNVPAGQTNIRAAQGKPNAKRLDVEQAVRGILNSIPA
jgi:hypothetical protein